MLLDLPAGEVVCDEIKKWYGCVGKWRLAIRAVVVLSELIIASSSRYFGTYPLVVGVSNRIVQ